ncbi:membrane protein insertase YidC [Microbacteriaceae bacterium VKM Ac-2854]|nr:membrane protein insertase YidC [Microbacteriaceae bacterium VKM Ac-2854]
MAASFNIYEFGPVAAALDGAYAVVDHLSTLLAPIAGAQSSAAAIVLLTVLVRLLLTPVGVSQRRAQLARLRLAPKLASLRTRYGTDPQRLQKETLALYAAENVSPFAGFGPLLLQAPVLSIVYGLFLQTTINGHANALLAHTLGSASLGSSIVAQFATGGWVVGSVILLLILLVVLVSRWRGLSQADGPVVPLARALSWLPLTTVAFAAFVPLAAALYLLVTTTWTLGEREVLRRAIPA